MALLSRPGVPVRERRATRPIGYGLAGSVVSLAAETT